MKERSLTYYPGGYEAIKPNGLKAAAGIVQACVDGGMRVIVVHGTLLIFLLGSKLVPMYLVSNGISPGLYSLNTGAGSFGHPQAKKYRVSSGWRQYETGNGSDDIEAIKQMRYGFAVTRCSVTKLNHLITEELVGKGIAACSFSPCGTWVTSNKVVVKVKIEALQPVTILQSDLKLIIPFCLQQHNIPEISTTLDLGMVPILHGDCVIDEAKGCGILSGDVIIRELAKSIPGVCRVVFLTDVDGVYDRNPSTEGARLIPKVLVDENGKLAKAVSTEAGSNDDVTGGMELKLGTAISVVCESEGRIPVLICNVEKDSTMKACITGELDPKEGTVIERSVNGHQSC